MGIFPLCIVLAYFVALINYLAPVYSQIKSAALMWTQVFQNMVLILYLLVLFDLDLCCYVYN